MSDMQIVERRNNFKRGEIYIATLGRDVLGSEQAGKRPVLIIQNDVGNKYSPTLVVVMLSTKMPKKCLCTHVYLNKEEYIGLNQNCIVMTEQIKTISKERLEVPFPVAKLDRKAMSKVENAILVSLGIAI